jgi:hypothetical protein
VVSFTVIRRIRGDTSKKLAADVLREKLKGGGSGTDLETLLLANTSIKTA